MLCCVQFLKDGIAKLNIPYSYGFAIILLTVLVKLATYPLTKKQVRSFLLRAVFPILSTSCFDVKFLVDWHRESEGDAGVV